MRRLLDIEPGLENDVLDALAEMEKVPGTIDKVIKYVKRIRYTPGKTHTDVTDGTVYLGDKHLNSDLLFLASTLVHETAHQRFHRIKNEFDLRIPQQDEERSCIMRQAEFLERAGYEMDGVRFTAEELTNLLYSQYLLDGDL